MPELRWVIAQILEKKWHRQEAILALMAMPLEYLKEIDLQEFEYFIVIANSSDAYDYKISPGFQELLNEASQP